MQNDIFSQKDVINDCISLTRELIKIPSQSTSATSSSDHPEAEICKYLSILSKNNGITFELQEALPGRNNFILKLPKDDSPRLLITAHMDTVSGQGMSNPFGAIINNGNIYGRGACDNKGSLSVLMSTFMSLHKHPHKLCYDLTIAGTIDEESTMAGAAKLAKENPAGWDLCLAMEPSLLKPISSHIGVYRCRIVIPRDKNQANNKLTKKIMQEIKTDLQTVVEKVTSANHSKLGKAKFTITVIENDETTSMPRILVDIRLLPTHNPAKIHADIIKTVDNKARVIPLFTGLGIEADPQNSIIQSFQQSIRRNGVPEELIAVPFPSDCSQLRGSGECMVWGPGDPQNAHRDNEFIAINQLEKACAILHDFLTTPIA